MDDLIKNLIAAIQKDVQAGILPEHLNKLKITETTTIQDLNIDSLGKMNLMAALMDITDKYLSDDMFDDNMTIGQILAVIQKMSD